MQVKLSKLLVASIIFGTFVLVVIHTFYQNNFNDVYGKMEEIQIRDANAPDLKASTQNEREMKFKMPVKGERNIIFLETTCILNTTGFTKENSKLILKDGRACAIESAAKTNANSKIYLFYSCPLEFDSISRSDELVKRVLDYPNVHVWHQSMDSVFAGSPLEDLYVSGKIKASKYPKTHGSDVLRFLMLWKYGGIYLDLDFIVTRSFDALGSNFVGSENWEYLNSAALGLASEGIGAKIAQECIEELRTNFRGYDWGYNGPALISRIMRRSCGVADIKDMTLQACNGFNVLPTPVFYPLYFTEWRLFYSEAASSDTMPKFAAATAVHLWNSMKVLDRNKDPVKLERGSRQPIALLQQTFCPSVNQIVVDDY